MPILRKKTKKVSNYTIRYRKVVKLGESVIETLTVKKEDMLPLITILVNNGYEITSSKLLETEVTK